MRSNGRIPQAQVHFHVLLREERSRRGGIVVDGVDRKLTETFDESDREGNRSRVFNQS